MLLTTAFDLVVLNSSLVILRSVIVIIVMVGIFEVNFFWEMKF